MEKLTDEVLNRTVQIANREGKTIHLKLIDSMYHMIEEDLQHRGEINGILWQQNITPPLQNWFSWKRATNRI